MPTRRLTPDAELRLHLAKAQQFWREDRLEEANQAMRNALRIGLPPGHWYDFQRMIEAELAAREHSQQFAVSEAYQVEVDPSVWGHQIGGFEAAGKQLIDQVAGTMHLTWDRPVLLTLFTEDSWLDFMHARYGYYAMRAESHKICLPPSAFRHPSTFRRAMLHESTHAAAHQLAGEQIPRWLDEGLAVWMEGGVPLPWKAPRLSLNAISAGFERFDVDLGTQRSHLSYAAAANFVERQIELRSLPKLLEVLRRLGEGETIERAWRSIFSDQLRNAEREWQQGLQKLSVDRRD